MNIATVGTFGGFSDEFSIPRSAIIWPENTLDDRYDEDQHSLSSPFIVAFKKIWRNVRRGRRDVWLCLIMILTSAGQHVFHPGIDLTIDSMIISISLSSSFIITFNKVWKNGRRGRRDVWWCLSMILTSAGQPLFHPKIDLTTDKMMVSIALSSTFVVAFSKTWRNAGRGRKGAW